MDKRAMKRANGEMLVHAIRTNDMATFQKILQRIAVLDDVDIIEREGRPLYFAIVYHRFDMAKALVQRGASVNFVPTSRTSNHLMCYAASEQEITFLLQNGSRIPKGVSQDTQTVAKAYICRSWAPESISLRCSLSASSEVDHVRADPFADRRNGLVHVNIELDCGNPVGMRAVVVFAIRDRGDGLDDLNLFAQSQ